MGRLSEFVREAFTPQQPEPVRLAGTVQGSTTIELGCEACPNKRQVIVGCVGNLALSMEPPVPLSVSVDLQVAGTGERGERTRTCLSGQIFEVNTEACDDTNICSNEHAINVYANNIAKDPDILELSVEPRIDRI